MRGLRVMVLFNMACKINVYLINSIFILNYKSTGTIRDQKSKYSTLKCLLEKQLWQILLTFYHIATGMYVANDWKSIHCLVPLHITNCSKQFGYK